MKIDWQPLGDQALLAYCDDEAAAARLARGIRRSPPDWLLDVVQAYASVAVFFDLGRINGASVGDELSNLAMDDQPSTTTATLHEIPVCYERGPDLVRVAEYAGLDAETVIRLHLETEYAVYAIGFCPGFPYLGYLPREICGVPRLPSPRIKVPVGSVGLTGRQTGIYTEARPGGWNLIGQTPMKLVDVRAGYFPLKTGDRVRFRRVDEAEFQSYANQQDTTGRDLNHRDTEAQRSRKCD